MLLLVSLCWRATDNSESCTRPPARRAAAAGSAMRENQNKAKPFHYTYISCWHFFSIEK